MATLLGLIGPLILPILQVILGLFKPQPVLGVEAKPDPAVANEWWAVFQGMQPIPYPGGAK